jgi:hypothetical protein
MYIEFANFHLNNATSCSSTDGSVYVQGINPINNGQYPFDYLWSTGDTELSISNLSVGSYTLTVQDDNGCTAQETIIIEADEQPDLEATIMRPCKDLTNGVIEVFIFVMDTDTEVVFTWTGPTQLQPIQDGPSSRIENLGPGIYFLTIEDPESGCTIERQYVLEELELCDDEELAINENNIGYITSCPDQPTGGLSVYATGGNPSFNPALECDYSQYNYVWYNSDNEEVSQSKVHLTSQFAGSYRVEITDACGRMVTGQYIIPEYDRMVLRLESDLACPGMAVAELTVQGTTAPYIYQWSNGGQSETIEGLDEGIYSVTVTDKHGCKQSDSIFVETYPEMELDFDFVNPCFVKELDDGVPGHNVFNNPSINLSVLIDGIPVENLTYQWDDDNQSNTEDLNDISINEFPPVLSELGLGTTRTFSVTVTDDHGCIKEGSINLYNTAEIEKGSNEECACDILVYCGPQDEHVIDLAINYKQCDVWEEDCRTYSCKCIYPDDPLYDNPKYRSQGAQWPHPLKADFADMLGGFPNDIVCPEAVTKEYDEIISNNCEIELYCPSFNDIGVVSDDAGKLYETINNVDCVWEIETDISLFRLCEVHASSCDTIDEILLTVTLPEQGGKIELKSYKHDNETEVFKEEIILQDLSTGMFNFIIDESWFSKSCDIYDDFEIKFEVLVGESKKEFEIDVLPLCPSPEARIPLKDRLSNRSTTYELKEIKVYPNPVTDVCIIESYINQKIEVKLLNQDGKLISQFKLAKNEISELDCSNLNNGVYFLNFRSNEYNSTQKIIIIHD